MDWITLERTVTKSILLFLQSEYDVPFILCSGYSDFSIESSDTDIGIDVLLNKPFDEKVLLQHISQLLDLYR